MVRNASELSNFAFKTSVLGYVREPQISLALMWRICSQAFRAPIVMLMQIRTKLVMSVSTLAAVVVACSVLLLWKTYSATHNQKRASLAYEELTGYLCLSSEVLGTFKRVRRDLLN